MNDIADMVEGLNNIREQKFAKTIEKVSNMWYKKNKLKIV